MVLLAMKRSLAVCKFIQNSGVVPNTMLNNIAVSAVMSLLPFISVFILCTGTFIFFASLIWLIFIGPRNSSDNISPYHLFNALSESPVLGPAFEVLEDPRPPIIALSPVFSPGYTIRKLRKCYFLLTPAQHKREGGI